MDAFALDIFDADPVDARTPSVGAYFIPGPPQNIGPDKTVIQGMEPAVPFLLAAR